MAGHSPLKTGVNARLACGKWKKKDVDARDKRGHDVEY
jgi:hypothetical protein